jgi:hypothetical protein
MVEPVNPNGHIDLDFQKLEYYPQFLLFQHPLEEKTKILCKEMLKIVLVSLKNMFLEGVMFKILLG